MDNEKPDSCFRRNDRKQPEDDKQSDDHLYNLCKRYGENARLWRQKFSGLLPEVSKRKLYEKKGFASIFEFAKKLAGLSEEQVRLVLNLEKRFEKTLALKELLVEGKVSVNKLARVASIANSENEMFLATQVQVLSKSAVDTLVRDEKNVDVDSSDGNRRNDNGRGRDDNGLRESFFGDKSLPVQTNEALKLSPEVQQKLLELQQKGIDINDLLLKFLGQREQEIIQKKEDLSEKITQREAEKSTTKPVTRYISVPIKNILHEEYGTKCSIKICQKPAEVIHHSQRFSAYKSHDPKFLVPLCKDHHELAHSADLAYHEIRGRNR